MGSTQALRTAVRLAARACAAIALTVRHAAPAAGQVEPMDDEVLTKVAFDELELLMSGAIKPFWDLQAGRRREFRPTPDIRTGWP